SAERSAIRTRHLGSVSFIVTTSVGADGVRAVADAVQALATPDATGGVRFFVAANQEGGQIQALRGPGFSTIPTAVDQGKQAPGVATSAKHFPGLGRVQGNTDFTAIVTDRVTTLDDPYLQSFRQTIEASVPFVMVALATYTRIDPNHPAVFSPIVMQLLRGS